MKIVVVAILALFSAAAAPPPPAAPPPIPSKPAPAPAALASTTDVVGTWTGTLMGQLPLALTVVQDADGLMAALEIPAQGATLKVDALTWKDGALHLDIRDVNGSYDGTLSKDGLRLEGTWTQGTAMALVLERTPAEPAEPAAPPPLDVPLDVQVPSPPIPFRAGGQQHLVYELHLTNMSRRTVSLTRIDAVDEAGRVRASIAGLDLLQLECPGTADLTGLKRALLGPGLRAVAYLWITVDGKVPARLEHHITARVSGVERVLTAGAIAPDKAAVVVVGPPLRGDRWRAGNGASNRSLHRRTLLTTGGRASVPQRFAIDFVRTFEDGQTAHGDPSRSESYRAYGTEVLAVADGVVVKVVDGLPQSTPGEPAPFPITLDNIAGNMIVLDIGRGHNALFAHLQPGSLKVKAGDKVKRGQVLGLLGNSGNSSEPHLHFQINPSPNVLGSEGIPYAFDAFQVTGAGAPTKCQKELPLDDDVVAFP